MYRKHIFDASELLVSVRKIIRPYVGVAADIADLSEFIADCLRLKFYGTSYGIAPSATLVAMGTPTEAAYRAVEQVCYILDNYVAHTPLAQYDPEHYAFTVTIDHMNTMTVHVVTKHPTIEPLDRLKEQARIAIEFGEYDNATFQRRFMEQFRVAVGL